jgi:hypothetical protein
MMAGRVIVSNVTCHSRSGVRDGSHYPNRPRAFIAECPVANCLWHKQFATSECSPSAAMSLIEVPTAPLPSVTQLRAFLEFPWSNGSILRGRDLEQHVLAWLQEKLKFDQGIDPGIIIVRSHLFVEVLDLSLE